MNKIVFIMAVCLLTAIGSQISAQEHTVRFYSVTHAEAYLSDNIGGDAGLCLNYRGGEDKPQYLIMNAASVKKEIGYTAARFLVNKKDSDEKGASTLAFVNGKLYDDSTLVLQGMEGAEASALFSFRLADKANKDGDFLIESWSDSNGTGEWVKIEHGKPVLVKTTVDLALNSAADIFNVEKNQVSPDKDLQVAVNPYVVTADYGMISIQGAGGKTALVTDAFGQKIARKVLASDEVTLSAPAGIAFVAIDNQPAIKVLVK